jgi:hypothetical protein
MLYSALTEAQRALVVKTFCDAQFGKDPAWFDYTITPNAITRARLPEHAATQATGKPRRSQVITTAVTQTHPGPRTPEMEHRYTLAIQIAARHLAHLLKGIDHETSLPRSPLADELHPVGHPLHVG